MTQGPFVDVVILRRQESPLDPAVQRGLARQSGIRLAIHQCIGSRQASDSRRWDTIVRARNAGKSSGTSPWLMFLDDDVELPEGAIRNLLDQLIAKPQFGALAASYLNEPNLDNSRHVAMGATLFRRSVLDRIRFRWEEGRCECQCCCSDLRRMGIGIAYATGVSAKHIPGRQFDCNGQREPVEPDTDRQDIREVSPTVNSRKDSPSQPGVVLAAFDDRHFKLFRDRFYPSLRLSGNNENVRVAGYGLPQSQRRTLEGMPGVRVFHIPHSRRERSAARFRLRDFPNVIADLNPDTPVAYWDTGDSVFQASLSPLWDAVRAHPGKLLAAREPIHHPENLVVARWTLSISDPQARKDAYDLLTSKPVLNSGFAAGSVATMTNYFNAAHRLRDSVAMAGSSDWGDQTALNIYCYTQPDAWHETSETWNYCLFGRVKRMRVRNGIIVDGEFTPSVIHGNGGMIDWVRRFHSHVVPRLAGHRSRECASP